MSTNPSDLRAAMIADGFVDPPAVDDEYEDLTAGHREIVTITGVWKIQAGWSVTVARRRVDSNGETIPSGCGEGRIFVDRLTTDFRKVG